MDLVVDKIRSSSPIGNGLQATFATNRDACGRIQIEVYLKAARKLALTGEDYAIAKGYFVEGFRQSTLARRAGRTRQQVHVLCSNAFKSIQKVLTEMKEGS